MNKKKFFFVSTFSRFLYFLIVLFSVCPAKAQSSKNVSFKTDSEIQKLLTENKIPAVGIGIIQNGKLTQVEVIGERKIGEAAPADTIFNVASLTKPVTALVALKLASAGKLNLDEPLDKYWIDPDIKDDPRHKKLTTRIVLSHRTGFANWRWLNESKKLEFAFEPGTKYQYSGEGFEYLRKALENKFQKPLEQLAAEMIFKPLKMRETRFIWDASMPEARFAVGYDKEKNPYKINKTIEANAADDLLTTVGDYGKFLISVMNADGLSKEIFNQMVSHQIKTKENKYFGLGWEIYELKNGEYALSHGGSDKGAQTIVILLPKSKQGLIIFTNSDNGTNLYVPLINKYLKDYGKQIIDIEMKQN